MICKIIEDDYTFEQIESIEAIFELEKKYNLNISIEDKSYPELYPEIGLQPSYKVYKNDKLIAFSGFLFYFYAIADLTSFDIAKICRFKIKHFPKQYEINLDLLKFGEIGTIWYLMESKWWSYFTSENKQNFLHEGTFEEIFLSQDFNKRNYKDLIKLLKYSKKVRAPIAECMYKYVQLHNYPISSYGKCERLLSKYADYFNELFTLFVTKDACLSLANKEKAYLTFRKTVLTAGKEVSDALKIFQTQNQFIDFKEKELNAYTKAASYSQDLMNYGMASFLEVLNADVNKLNAELNIANAKYTKLQSGVELYRALGGGWQ